MIFIRTRKLLWFWFCFVLFCFGWFGLGLLVFRWFDFGWFGFGWFVFAWFGYCWFVFGLLVSGLFVFGWLVLRVSRNAVKLLALHIITLQILAKVMMNPSKGGYMSARFSRTKIWGSSTSSASGDNTFPHYESRSHDAVTIYNMNVEALANWHWHQNNENSLTESRPTRRFIQAEQSVFDNFFYSIYNFFLPTGAYCTVGLVFQAPMDQELVSATNFGLS